MDKLIKQLKREFQKNPKKVFLLGGLFAVLMYVFYPLVFPNEEKKPVRRPTAAVAATAVATTSDSATAAPVWRWQDLDRALNDDPRMRSAGGEKPAGDVAARNPFESEFDLDAALEEHLTDVYAELAAESAVRATVAPSQTLLDGVPLELSSTLVGESVRTAVVNGRSFREGTSLGVVFGAPLKLTKIEPRSVVVEWQGLQRTLKILRPSETSASPRIAGLPQGR